jgi:hypothetical protein
MNRFRVGGFTDMAKKSRRSKRRKTLLAYPRELRGFANNRFGGHHARSMKGYGRDWGREYPCRSYSKEEISALQAEHDRLTAAHGEAAAKADLISPRSKSGRNTPADDLCSRRPVQLGINPGQSPYIKEKIMTLENSEKLVDAERHGGPEEARLILEWRRREHDQDAEVFAKVGDHGAKFRYCHWAVVKRTNKNAVDAQVSRKGWRYLGTVGQAAACADEMLASLFNGQVGQPYKWREQDVRIQFADGDEINYVVSAPVELFETVDIYGREIVQLLRHDWDLVVSHVEYDHLQILPYQARQAGALNAA